MKGSSATTARDVRSALRGGHPRIGVVGCGFAGLPLAVSFAEAGCPVTAVDIDPERVRRLRAGDSYIRDVPSEALASQLREGRFDATTEFEALRDVDAIFLAVPTPFDRAKQPDLGHVIQATESIAGVLRKGQLIVLESTTYPGTTDEVLRPILERSGLQAGKDFHLAFSPERIDPGNKSFGVGNTPRVVGGVDAESTELACAVLEIVAGGRTHPVSSARVAEMTKLLENTFRAVNIGFVNELAMLCHRMGIDIWEVIEAASTKPYGYMPFYPGPGMGGHCIPVDPYYLSWKAREFDFHTKFIDIAAEINLAMPFFTVGRIREFLSDSGRPIHGSRIIVLGAAFKRDVDDARESAAVRVMELLHAEGAIVEYHDPFVASVKLASSVFASNGEHETLDSVALETDRLRQADCVVILVGHSTVDYDHVLAEAPRVFDAVNATRGRQGRATVERL